MYEEGREKKAEGLEIGEKSICVTADAWRSISTLDEGS